MEKEKVVHELKQILVRSLNLNCRPEEIAGENLEAEFNINSIDALEILVWVENHFQIEVADEDLSATLVNSLDNLAEYILNKKKSMAV